MPDLELIDDTEYRMTVARDINGGPYIMIESHTTSVVFDMELKHMKLIAEWLLREIAEQERG